MFLPPSQKLFPSAKNYYYYYIFVKIWEEISNLLSEMKNEEKKTYQSEKKSYQWTDGEPMHQKMTNFEEKKPEL